ncbi:MAG TPA: DUF2283 domain-containing protein [Bacteroidia bacterium]|nr:DUF2283 domain-containing protein [Bacteroidia bacterium]
MVVNYDSKTDLLYLRLDQGPHQVINKKITDDIVLDIDEDGKIIGIEIMYASKNVQLKTLLPVTFDFKKAG